MQRHYLLVIQYIISIIKTYLQLLGIPHFATLHSAICSANRQPFLVLFYIKCVVILSVSEGSPEPILNKIMKEK